MQDVIKSALEQFDHMIVIETNEYITSLFAGANKPLVTQSTQLMRDRGLGQPQALHKFTDANFSIQQSADNENARRARITSGLVAELPVSRLGAYGLREEQVAELVGKAQNASSMKANPIVLTPKELAQTLRLAI